MEPAQRIVREIVLTAKERELFQLLREVLEKKNLRTTLRVAGGWVRDKVHWVSFAFGSCFELAASWLGEPRH